MSNLEENAEREVHRRGLYYVCPSEILDSELLEPLAKLLYMLLSGLADQDGSCFPSDKYLAQRLKCSERQCRDLLLQLESLELIERQTYPCSNNPFRKVRTIYVKTEFKNVLQRNARAASERHEAAQACRIERNTRAGIVSEVNIESEEKKEPPTPKGEFLSFGKYVKMSKEEYEELCSKYTKDTVDRMIENINDYLSSTGKKPYKDYPATIRNWIRRQSDSSQGEIARAAAPLSVAQLNEKFALKVKELNPKSEIDVGHDYIELRAGPMICDQIRFSAHGFKEQVSNWLRKRNLIIPKDET